MITEEIYNKIATIREKIGEHQCYIRDNIKGIKPSELKKMREKENKIIQNYTKQIEPLKQQLYKEIYDKHHQHFKANCVVCEGAMLPIDDPNKAKEYERGGNYCYKCISMIDNKIQFFKCCYELNKWQKRLKNCKSAKKLKVGINGHIVSKKIILRKVRLYTKIKNKLAKHIIDTWKVDPEKEAKKFNMFRNNIYEVFNVKD